MFSIEIAVRDAVALVDTRLSGHPAWAVARAELLSPDVPESRKKRLLVLCGAALGEPLIGPQNVLVDITGRCNANCVFCRDHSPRVGEREDWRSMEMPFDLLMRVIDDVERLGASKIPLLAAGEPTMYSRINEVLDRFYGSPLTFEIFSNGLKWPKGVLERLARCDNGRVYVSISAARAESFAEQRPGMPITSLARVQDNVSALVRARAKGGGPRVLLVHIVNAGNFREVIPMMEQAIEMGVDEVQYKLTEISDICPDLKLDVAQIDSVRLELAHAKNLARAAGVAVQDNIDVQLDWVDPESGDYVPGLFDHIPCRIGYEFCRVRRDGEVSFCCALKFLGNLNKTPFEELWRGAVWSKARRVAVDFPHGADMALPGGDRLRDGQCDWCYNYVMNIHTERDWRALTDPAAATTHPADMLRAIRGVKNEKVQFLLKSQAAHAEI